MNEFIKTNLLNFYSITITLRVSGKKLINPFHATGLFRYPLMFSGGIERDQWHEMG